MEKLLTNNWMSKVSSPDNGKSRRGNRKEVKGAERPKNKFTLSIFWSKWPSKLQVNVVGRERCDGVRGSK